MPKGVSPYDDPDLLVGLKQLRTKVKKEMAIAQRVVSTGATEFLYTQEEWEASEKVRKADEYALNRQYAGKWDELDKVQRLLTRMINIEEKRRSNKEEGGLS